VRLLDRFDSWVRQGPFTPADLGIYRIVYAVGALFTVPNIAWLAEYPDFMFHPPPGPLQLLSGFPPLAVLIGLEVLRSATLLAVGFGLWTKYASIASAVMLMSTYGLTYCLGKIDHTILLVLPPLVLAFANWGDRFSIDAWRHQRAAPSAQEQWPLRLLGLLVGWGFFAAALTKLGTGWLSFDSQAARGYYVLAFVTEDRTYWLAEWVANHDWRVAWELADWLTVAFEFAILLALPWWRAFRITLAVATTFHLGVLLVMNIDFSHAVIAYGAFVSWGTIARRVGDSRLGKFAERVLQGCSSLFTGAMARVLLVLLAVAIGSSSWFLMVSPAGRIEIGRVGGVTVIVVGALIGTTYLVQQVWAALNQRLHPRAVEGGVPTVAGDQIVR
jgi:hypothetical protein